MSEATRADVAELELPGRDAEFELSGGEHPALTRGPVLRAVIGFAAPLTLANLLQQT